MFEIPYFELNLKVNNFTLKFYQHNAKTDFYTIQFQNDSVTEFDKFLLKFQNDSKYQEDFQVILSDLLKIGNDVGAVERKFRYEKKAHALPGNLDSSKLRLYCFRVSDEILVLGNGAIKTSQKAQDGEFTAPIFGTINNVAALITHRIRHDSIHIKGKTLSGNLIFFK